jgi:hypothetical protein
MTAATDLAGLVRDGRLQVSGRFPTVEPAWDFALDLTSRALHLDPSYVDLPRLQVVGEFTVPPAGTVQRDFQALHLDFGLPRMGPEAVPVARFTALYREPGTATSAAATRIVPLRRLLGQRSWPQPEVVARRLSNTALDDSPVEGILARIVEAVDQTSELPAKSDRLLCGMEFAALDEERDFFARHGVPLAEVEEEIVLSDGELLVFDNLAVAHGRRGLRTPGQLQQLCIGFDSLDREQQAAVMRPVISAFRSCSSTARRP